MGDELKILNKTIVVRGEERGGCRMSRRTPVALRHFLLERISTRFRSTQRVCSVSEGNGRVWFEAVVFVDGWLENGARRGYGRC